MIDSFKHIKVLITRKLPEKIEDYMLPQQEKGIAFQDAVGQDSINRFDKANRKKKRVKKHKKTK